MKKTIQSPLQSLKNIGATLAKKLNEIGVQTPADLAETGPVNAYLKMKENSPGKTIPVCYYLYSLQGALLDLHWNDLPGELKEELLMKVGRK